MKTTATSTTMTTENNDSLGFNRWMGLSRNAKILLFRYICFKEGLTNAVVAHVREKELLSGLSEENYKLLKKGRYLTN